MSILTHDEITRIQSASYRYINLIQRLENQNLSHRIHRADGTFVVETNGFLIPYFEAPYNTPEVIGNLLSPAIFGDHLNFAGIPKSHYMCIANHDAFEIEWNEPCFLYVYDAAPFAMQETPVPHGLTLDCLRPSDIECVFENYTYKDDGVDYIRDVIESRPTFCLRDGQKPVSWVVRREDGSMGIMYTLSDYRRLGLGDYLSKQLVNLILSLEQTPYLHIICDNTASIKLAESLGFSNAGEINWFGVKRKK